MLLVTGPYKVNGVPLKRVNQVNYLKKFIINENKILNLTINN